MATVEILKGPQGTLFGGSGLNGMIRYVPEPPEFDAVRVKYFGQFNRYPGSGDSGWSYGAVLNAPFAGDAAAVRLMGFRRDAPGFVDDTQSGEQDVNRTAQHGVRGMASWLPGSGWKLSLLGASQRTRQDDVAFTNNREGRLERSNTPRPSPVRTAYDLANVGIERAFEWGDVVSQTSSFEKEYDAFLDASRTALEGQEPLLGVGGYSKSRAFVQELRLVSAPGGPWKWLAGGFYYRMDLFDCAEAGAGAALPLLGGVLSGLPVPLAPVDALVATPCPQNAHKLEGTADIAQLIGDLTISEQALFGELSRELGEDWEATLGARLYRTGSEGSVTSAGALYSAQTRGQVGRRDGALEEEGISPKASLAWQPSSALRAYFTAARGFRFGGPQLSASTPTTTVPEYFRSDSLWSYELGLRTDWLDQALRVDASVYFIDWKDPQVYQASNDGLTSFIDNVGGVEGKGADVSLRILPPFLEGLSLNASASWNRTVTTEPFTSATRVEVPAGSPWPLAPRWQTSATLAYLLPLEAWRAAVAARHTYAGEACNAIECTAQVFGYQTWDLNLSVGSLSSSSWPELAVSLTNLTDERGISNVSSSALLGDSVNYIAPRALMVRVGGSF